MSEFELKDQSGLLTVTALARALGVTDQTVYNYEGRGMAPVGTDPKGNKLWDPAAARAWVEKNGPSKVRGGKRRGAGTKSKSQRVEEKPIVEVGLQNSLALVFEEAEKRLVAMGVPPEVAKNAGEVQALIGAVKSGELTLSQIEVVKQGFSAVKELLAVRKAEGELVSRSEVKSEVGQHLTVIRRTLESLPGRAAAELVAELKLPADSIGEVKRLLVEKVKFVMRQVGEGESGRAADLQSGK